jgi:hypothetical protein
MIVKTSKLVAALAAAAALTPGALAQTPAPAAQPDQQQSQLALRPIEPANALEHAFVSALTNEAMRPIFRRQLLESYVALPMASSEPDAAPLEITLRDGVTASLVFTSVGRLDEIMGTQTPRIILTGRAALERLRGKNVIINARLMPMLTLEPEDVTRYLETPASPASSGPTQ